MEKEMATHSSILAWRIPCTEEPYRLRSMGSQRVRHDSVTEPLPLFKGINLKHVEENLSPSCKNHEGNTQTDTDVASNEDKWKTQIDFLRYGVRIKFKRCALDFHILLEAHRAEVQEVGIKERTQNHKYPRNLNRKPLLHKLQNTLLAKTTYEKYWN